MTTLWLIAVALFILAAFFLGMAVQDSLYKRQKRHNQSSDSNEESQYPFPMIPPEFNDLPKCLGDKWLLIVPRRNYYD